MLDAVRAIPAVLTGRLAKKPPGGTSVEGQVPITIGNRETRGCERIGKDRDRGSVIVLQKKAVDLDMLCRELAESVRPSNG